MGRATLEEYLSAGMDVAGYLEPEVTSDDTYPAYIRDEVEETIEKLQRLQGFDTVTFGFITDMHYATKFKHTHLIRLRRTLNAYRAISKATHCDFLTIGGDHVTNGCKKYVSDCYRALREELSGIRYMPVNGNHDDNSIWDISFINQRKAENHLNPKERYTLFYNGTPAEGAIYPRKDRGLYYYVDNSDQRVRYIFLDTDDFPDEYNEDGSMKYPAQHACGYSPVQLEWLTKEALMFEEDGWTVVVFQHIPSIQPNETGDIQNTEGVEGLIEILKARKSGTDCIYAQFSNAKKCEIAAVFCGHTHKDSIVYLDGIPHITTTNSVMYAIGNKGRVDGTKTELAFDVVSLNKRKKTVKLIRVGFGEDRSVSWE